MDAVFGSGNIDFGEANFHNCGIHFNNTDFGQGDVSFIKADLNTSELHLDNTVSNGKPFTLPERSSVKSRFIRKSADLFRQIVNSSDRSKP
jgi:hypothetical protein